MPGNCLQAGLALPGALCDFEVRLRRYWWGLSLCPAPEGERGVSWVELAIHFEASSASLIPARGGHPDGQGHLLDAGPLARQVVRMFRRASEKIFPSCFTVAEREGMLAPDRKPGLRLLPIGSATNVACLSCWPDWSDDERRIVQRGLLLQLITPLWRWP